MARADIVVKSIGRRILDALAQRIAARIRAPKGATERSLLLLGRMLALNAKSLPAGTPLAEAEFGVFSQFGEDGIIQHLLAHVPVSSGTFVEFGVQHYVESNTRFLLLQDNWSGLVIDSSPKYIERIRADGMYWRHDLTATCAFITRDNIAALIAERFPEEELGLLSIDIDGNDYWVWEAITHVRPSIVICEYNSVLGARLAVTVPYSGDFDRAKAHYSHLYFGASLPALCRLAERKGYAFVGSNSAGVNAFFVRKDRLGGLRALSAMEGYVASKFRESRDPSGRMSHLAGMDRLRAIADLPLLDLETGNLRPIRELFARELSRRK
ncbi:MAG TPA: hypothetical protein VFO57_07575 [Burkholderiales bacterium]|nr:hypothetical protein [Burkholderiales bacterium]